MHHMDIHIYGHGRMMQTNKIIKRDSELDILGKKLIESAYNYWKQYQKELGSAAVVWLEAEDGHFVLFTRGEYKRQILSAANRETDHGPVMFEPFVSSVDSDKEDPF